MRARAGLLTALVLTGLVLLVGGWIRGWENTETDKWVAGAVADVPAPTRLNLEVTRLKTGPGKPVASGDLVNIDIRDLGILAPGTTDMFSQSAPIDSHGEASAWVGNLQTDRTTFPSTTRLTSNALPRDPHYDLGSADFRHALLGVPTGSTLRISIALPPRLTSEMLVSGRSGSIARTGIMFDYELYSQFVDPLHVTGREKGGNFQLQYGHSYEVTVRRACPTRLLVQDVALTQHGPRLDCEHVDWLICPVSTFRSARAQFAVMDGRCEQGEKIHIGPIAVIDKGATDNPAAFEPSILARIQDLRGHWPIE
jgi:hypothetical protein